MRVIFMGTPEIAVTVAEALRTAGHDIIAAVTQTDKPQGRAKTLTPPPVKQWATAHGITVMQPRTLKNDEAFAALAELKPEVIVVTAYGKILPKRVLTLPPFGCVNVHVSLLPRWRGAAPVQWAIMSGDTQTGATIMLMDEGIDTGPVLSQQAVDIAPDITGGELLSQLGEVGAALLCQTLPKLQTGALKPQPQQGESTYAPMLTRETECITWAKPAATIERVIRALSPSPYCFTMLNGQPLKIIKAAVAAAPEASAPPGTIIAISKSGITVATSNGSLLLQTVQPAGKKPMPAADYARGARLTSGMMFDAGVV